MISDGATGITLSPIGLAAIFLFAVFGLGALMVAPYAFSVDDVVYIEMARAMAERGSFALGANGGVEGAPVLTTMFTLPVNGEAIPQYPGLYGIIAAPFYALLGVKGLVLMNALACACVLLLTFRLADLLFADRRLAWAAMGLLGAATFLPAYGFAVWPHMLALALTLSATERAVVAARDVERLSYLNLALAGLLAGLAFNIRIDAVLGVIAIFFWLRLFAAPTRRSAALVFAAGVVPALLLSSAINLAKFGAFMPFYYAPAGKGANVSQYTAILGVAGLAVIASMLVDTSRAWILRAIELLRSPKWLAGTGLAALLAVILSEGARTYLHSVFVLVVDMQQVSDWQFINGIERLENGYVTFSGLTKTALLQSAPFILLALGGVAGFLRGRDVKANGLALMMIGAAICFFSLKQWHGGYGHNMRYLMLALPFLAILSARALLPLLGRLDERGVRLDLLVGAIVTLLVLRLAANAGPDSAAFLWSVYYAPICLALLFAGAAVWRNARPDRPRGKRIFHTATGAVLAMSAMVSVDDIAGHVGRVANYGPVVERTRVALPDGALMVTTLEPHMLGIREAGAFQIHPRWTPREDVAAAMTAFLAEERCVFVQSPVIRAELDPYVALSDATRPLPGFAEDDLVGLVFEPLAQPEGCLPD